MKKPSRTLSLIALFFFLLSSTACSYEPLTITGKVVDESGNVLSGVTVWACYSGWGWGEEGSLVWDKDTCSEKVQTDVDGMYDISFEGPVSSRLTARKDGWTQSDSFNTTHSRIVMTRMEDYSARLRDKADKRALDQCRRRDVETDYGYYCRAVLPGNWPVNLNYRDQAIAVTPSVLQGESQTEAKFAVKGSFRAVDAFSKEIVLNVNGEAQDLSFLIEPGEADCGQEIYFLEFMMTDSDAWGDAAVDLFVPSIKAMFEMNLHTCSAE